MSNHTKEPWLCDKRTVYALNKKGFNIFSAVVQDCRTSNSEMEENARRIVACVNACEGISTETLQQGNIADRVARPEQQRDALLAALEPFGYFRVEPFGWVDCGEKDEGAVVLYDQGTVNELLKQRDMLLDVLRKTADDLAYVAHCFDGSKLDDLAAGLSESTCPTETALIAERNCRDAISSVKGGAA